jgi:hypothetical protein
LLEFYPAHHEAVIVISRTHPLLPSIRQKAPLGKLADLLQQVAKSATLYIPPVRRREIADPDLAAKLKAPASTQPGSGKVAQRPGRPPIGPKPS